LQLTSALSKNGIYALIRRNEEGGLDGITFVDNERRIVFNGSDLGQGYSAAALQSRLADLPKEKIVQAQKPEKSTVRLLEKKEKAFEVKASKRPMGEESLLHQLLSSKASHNYVPVELLKKKRKKINTGLGL
jgi:hypothetical protein